jgi:hypothetical protein
MTDADIHGLEIKQQQRHVYRKRCCINPEFYDYLPWTQLAVNPPVRKVSIRRLLARY